MIPAIEMFLVCSELDACIDWHMCPRQTLEPYPLSPVPGAMEMGGSTAETIRQPRDR
jgi:hypothetical protein